LENRSLSVLVRQAARKFEATDVQALISCFLITPECI